VNGYKGACYRGYKSKDDIFAAFYCDEKMEFSRAVSHPTKSSSWKDVIILAQALIIFILICIIFLFKKIA
jgi:viroplasmin and RNaseH domain-containing protein